MRAEILKITCAAGLLAIAGLSSTHAAWAGENGDDATLTHAVEDALVAYPVAESQAITVEAFDGVVQLSGFVGSDNVRETAVKAAEGVSGVTAVHDNLKVRPDSQTADATVHDIDLTKKVENALIANPLTKSHEINVATADSVVQLSGFVESADIRDAAAKVAGSVPGVRLVQNQLEMKQAL